DGTQIAGDRTLKGEQLERLLLADRAEIGDLLVLVDHLLGESEIGFEKSSGGPLHRGPGEPGHLPEEITEFAHLFVVDDAHNGTAYDLDRSERRASDEPQVNVDGRTVVSTCTDRRRRW